MKKLIIPESHIALSSSNCIAEICADFFNYSKVKYFCYKRYRKKGLHSSLSSDEKWTQYFYSQGYQYTFLCTDLFYNYLRNFKFILWNSLPDNKLISHFRELFGYDNGIIITEAYADYNDYYIFAGDVHNPGIVNFFINNPELLFNFIFYFKDKGSDLIKESNSHMIKLPKNQKQSNVKLCGMALGSDEYQFQTKKYYVGDVCDKEVYLTNQEYKVTQKFILGYSSKEIAKDLGISPRTVESYLTTVKTKFNAFSRLELRDCLAKSILPLRG